MLNDGIKIVLLIMVLSLCGCASCYVAELRCEYNDCGTVDGIYYGEAEYPVIFPATWIAATVEIPTWWWPSKIAIARTYQMWLWPIGATCSVIDLPLSIASDIFMLPYDFCKTRNKEIKCQ